MKGPTQWILCRLPEPFGFFHDVEVIETYDRATRKLRCMACGRYFAMSDRHRVVAPWDGEFEEITCAMYGIPRTKK